MKLKKNPYTIEVLRRAFDILPVFSHTKPALSLAEIVAIVKLPKTMEKVLATKAKPEPQRR